MAFTHSCLFLTLAHRQDYVFSLLTGYTDPPAGITIGEGQYFNPYMPGGAISMAQALYNDTIQYDDGTPPSATQLAKDVCTFLKWTAEPEHDERKRLAIKLFFVMGTMTLGVWYWKRHIWTSLKSRKILMRPPKQDV